MARFAFKAAEDYAVKLSRLASADQKEIAGKAIYEGAKITADQIKQNIGGLPTDHGRLLKEGEKFSGVTPTQKQQLAAGLGVAKMQTDADGYNVKVGFDGYGPISTQKYPMGLPTQLLARSVESGSSVRQKHPFVRPAVQATKAAAVKKMGEIIDEEIARIMNT